MVTTAGGSVTAGVFTVSVGLLTDTTAVGPPTATVSVSGGGFAANESISFTMGGALAGSTLTSPNGSFSSVPVTVPSSAQPGSNTLAASGSRSGLVAGTPYLVRTDWAELGFGTANHHENPYENTLASNNVGGLGRAFVARATSFMQTGTTIVGGIAYYGSDDDYVYALDAASASSFGAKIWTYTTGGPIDSAPAVSHGYVYVGSEDSSLYDLNAATGAAQWTYAAPGVPDSAPVVANGVVYFTAHGFACAIDASYAIPEWSYEISSALYSTTVDNGTVYVTSAFGEVFAFTLPAGASPNAG